MTIEEAKIVLAKEYHIDNFTYLAKDVLLPDYAGDVHDVWFKNDIFSTVKQLGTSDACELTVFEVYLKEGTQNRRVAITQEMFKILRGLHINNALVAFVNANEKNFRISLLTSKYEFNGDKIVKVLSNPRRFSYTLGIGMKTKTAYKFLIEKGKVKDLNELIGRFSVEVVNKQFYAEIATAFTELVGGERNGKTYTKLLQLYGSLDHNKHAEFGVRLIGRIMFCWFLREKRSVSGVPLVPDDMLSTAKIDGSNNYYHQVLEPLFFELLNTPINSRKRDFDTDYYNKIPYLNGGLFSPHTDDMYRYDPILHGGRYGQVTIPNEWFKQLYQTLGQYNFTVDENTAYDIELSIDPEMLGRIFENLLAEINPETGENAKKSTGSFYTPRDIVDYMVDSSLCEYLKTKTGIDEVKLKALISYSKDDAELAVFNDIEKKKLIEALYTVTVLDPACGSGAFPIGMLQKIVYILQEVDPGADLWFDEMVKGAPIYVKQAFEKKFRNGELDYLRKITVIERSIYGIDIQPIAVEISRLRCFLSLIIEEKVDDTEDNRNIKPLPNLDFKFIIANSLIPLEKNVAKSFLKNESGAPIMESQMSLFEEINHIDKLKEIREEFFTADATRRAELKSEFQSLQQDMLIRTIQNSKLSTKEYEQLSQWKPFENKATDWFDPEWMFGIKDGFDIVIANPPYLDSENMTNSGLTWEREYISKKYNFAKGNWDIYIAFFEFGFRSLSKNGCEIYITPDKWISKPFGNAMRIGTIKNIKSVMFAGRKVFEASLVDSIITLIDRQKHNLIQIYNYQNGTANFAQAVDKRILVSPYQLDVLSSPFINLIAKIDSCSHPLMNYAVCENACATSDCYTLKEYIDDLSGTNEFNNNYLKIINTGTVGRFVSRWGISEMKYLKDKYLYPVVNREKFLSVFTNAYGAKAIKPKIIIKGLTLLDSSIDEDGIVIPGKSTMLISSNIDTLYLLMGIINSKLSLFYIKQKYSSSSYNGGITFTKDMINNLPIKNNHIQDYNEIGVISKHITENIRINREFDCTYFEKKIDSIMYRIYGLTPDEIAQVENSK